MKKRIDDIELLRGFAVLFVVIHHAADNLFTWSTPGLTRFYSYFGGWFGVDLFFAISGFVIARDLVPRLQQSYGTTHTLNITLAFWVRRAWRILPSAWLWLAIILIASLAFNQSGVFGTFRTNFEASIAGVLQVANIRFAETFMQREYGGSFVYWSLSLEEQFYLLFPLLILLSRRLLPYLLLALVLIQIFSVRSVMLMSFRTDALALGILLALWTQHSSYLLIKPKILSGHRAGCILMAGSFLCMAALASNQLHIVSIPVGLIALLSALLVWLASYDKNFLCAPGFFKQAMIWLGTRSYAVYLIHIPVFFFTRELWHRLYPEQTVLSDHCFYPFILISAGLILLLSELNYRWVEMPLRNKGAAIARGLAQAEPSARASTPAANPTRASRT
ncbi:acyltransferase [Pseudomonas sp.]|uniref:acyltransferase family protein n=1 Tax=Pseudomonas sp. TaxID=306 RepID=UPI0019EC70EF|nr:acyltransferase [Pseudomonas sp.]MBF0677171.1 acyltransferase [Pseudomonas sp.]